MSDSPWAYLKYLLTVISFQFFLLPVKTNSTEKMPRQLLFNESTGRIRTKTNLDKKADGKCHYTMHPNCLWLDGVWRTWTPCPASPTCVSACVRSAPAGTHVVLVRPWIKTVVETRLSGEREWVRAWVGQVGRGVREGEILGSDNRYHSSPRNSQCHGQSGFWTSVIGFRRSLWKAVEVWNQKTHLNL